MKKKPKLILKNFILTFILCVLKATVYKNALSRILLTDRAQTASTHNNSTAQKFNSEYEYDIIAKLVNDNRANIDITDLKTTAHITKLLYSLQTGHKCS